MRGAVDYTTGCASATSTATPVTSDVLAAEAYTYSTGMLGISRKI